MSAWLSIILYWSNKIYFIFSTVQACIVLYVTAAQECAGLKRDHVPFCGEFAWPFLLLCECPLRAVIRHASQLNWKLYIYVSMYTDEYGKLPRVFLPNACWDGGTIETYGCSSYTETSLFVILEIVDLIQKAYVFLC